MEGLYNFLGVKEEGKFFSDGLIDFYMGICDADATIEAKMGMLWCEGELTLMLAMIKHILFVNYKLKREKDKEEKKCESLI